MLLQPQDFLATQINVNQRKGSVKTRMGSEENQLGTEYDCKSSNGSEEDGAGCPRRKGKRR